MKEYDQFMRQVKGKKKTEAPVDTFAPTEGYANEFGSPASMKAALGYDPNSDFNSENKPTRKFSASDAGDQLGEISRKISAIKDPLQQMKAFNQFYRPAFQAVQQTTREAASGRGKPTGAEYEARMERMIAAYVQSGLSPQTARRLAMERMQA
jgi:hypothetical protein